MMRFLILLAILLPTIQDCTAFYSGQWRQNKNMPTYTPTTLDEVKKYLCMNLRNDHCEDESPGKIIINKIFDFTGSEGMKKEVGCYHKTAPAHCYNVGQLKLNVVNQCDGLKSTDVSYSVAGKCGIYVGSNKIIVGEKGGGLRGKGLRLRKSQNVEIRNLNITDINHQVIWGGDAIDLINVKNVLIDGNYFKNVGRQMIVTHFGSNTGVTIANNVFDGNTPYASHCNGHHYWLWLFLGKGDMITLQNNVILNTSGRGPHLVASDNSITILHMIQNTFYDVVDTGLIDLDDGNSAVLVEGNVFVNVKEIVHKNRGNLFMPQNSGDQKACEVPLGRQCLLNTIVHSGGAKPKNSLKTLELFGKFKKYLAKPIKMTTCMTKWINLPEKVKKCIK